MLFTLKIIHILPEAIIEHMQFHFSIPEKSRIISLENECGVIKLLYASSDLSKMETATIRFLRPGSSITKEAEFIGAITLQVNFHDISFYAFIRRWTVPE